MKLINVLISIVFIGHICIHASAQPNSEYHGDVLVLDKNEQLPDSAKLIDDIKVGGGAFNRNCGYVPTMDKAKDKARDMGGDIVKITELKTPDNWSACFRLRADVYYAADISQQLRKKQQQKDSLVNSLVPDTAQYALLFVYRSKGGAGGLVQYNLHEDDSTICRVRNGSRFTIRLLKTGDTNIWARTESRKDVLLNVKPGKAYFLKCFVTMGVVVGEPDFEIVDPYEGFFEYNYGNYNDK